MYAFEDFLPVASLVIRFSQRIALSLGARGLQRFHIVGRARALTHEFLLMELLLLDVYLLGAGVAVLSIDLVNWLARSGTRRSGYLGLIGQEQLSITDLTFPVGRINYLETRGVDGRWLSTTLLLFLLL